MTDYARAVWKPSMNFWSGREGHAITAIVLHGTAGPGAVSWFQNPQSEVSAHYVVDTDGSVTQCVAEDDSAWHAGVVTLDSFFHDEPNPNLWTIGIEHVRDTTNTSPITPAQLQASLALCADIERRRGPMRYITHDQIDVGRVCPGPGFPLDAFLNAGRFIPLDDGVYMQQWKSLKVTVAWNPQAAICKDWLARRKANDHTLGVPLGDEFQHGSGAMQIFTGGVAVWDGSMVTWY